jgi:hypothetical protein
LRLLSKLVTDQRQQLPYPLLDRLQGADELGDALAGDVLETAGFIDAGDDVGDAGFHLSTGAASDRLELLAGVEDSTGRFLQMCADGVELAARKRNVLGRDVIGADGGDLALGPVDIDSMSLLWIGVARL